MMRGLGWIVVAAADFDKCAIGIGNPEPDILVGTWRQPTEPIMGGRPNVILLTPDGWGIHGQGTIVPDILRPDVVRIAVGTDLHADPPAETEGFDALTFLRLSLVPD